MTVGRSLSWWGIVGIWLGYCALFLVMFRISGVDYDDLGDSTENVFRGIVISVFVMAIYLIAITTWLGWWRPAIFEKLPAKRWTLVVPILLFIASVISINFAEFGDLGAEYLLVLALGTILVGFSEELLCRGLILVGARQHTTETWAVVVSAVLFGLLHGINVLAGQAAGATVVQIFFATGLGFVLYVCRRTAGTLIVPMIIHATWDFGTFTHSQDALLGTTDATNFEDTLSAVAAIILYVLVIVSLVIVFWVWRKDPGTGSGVEETPMQPASAN